MSFPRLLPASVLFATSLSLASCQKQRSVVPEDRGRVRKLIAQAKRDGRANVNDGQFTICSCVEIATIEDAVANSVALVVRIDAKGSDLSPDGNDIRTWYQATVVHNLANATLPEVSVRPDAGITPPESVKVSPDSVLIRVEGGVFKQDGVTVTAIENPLSFTLGNTYLVFLSFDDNRDGRRTRGSRLFFGDGSAFAIHGDLLSPLAKRQGVSFAASLMSRCSGRLSMLERDAAFTKGAKK